MYATRPAAWASPAELLVAGDWLVLRAGRPVLLIEGQERRLTALPSASREDVATAVASLPGVLDADRGTAGRHKLTVEQWNGRPVTTTEGRALLEAAGFVRDYQGMTLYAAWRQGESLSPWHAGG